MEEKLRKIMETKVLEQEKKPCVFGEKIHENCPVRQNLSGKPDLSKWIKTTTAGEALDEMRGFIEAFTKTTLQTEATTLSKFCVVCPYLESGKH